ncbi:putative ABC exporter domain-containing protein [Anditalea andensis]|uniref:Uncharacterized protein n=1 Tax=Anditalea andensis TaxID=1048983 RepID=A0A074KZV6_9BACT|nr:putative ABC exporter domain-containing protein [Anditalea andensis]KEO74469.1 hypothetical protein EL17_06950 [Anditalea andensis]
MNDFKLLFKKDFYIVLNNIKLILRNPFRLIPYALLVGYFSLFYFRGRSQRFGDSSTDLKELQGIDYGTQNVIGTLTVIGLIFLTFQLFRATKKNVSFFTMADVNFLFTSPVSPANILIYYMVRSLLPAIGMSLIFIVYGASQMSAAFDLQYSDMILMAIAIALFFFMLSPIKFLIYTLNTKYGILPQIKLGILAMGVILALMIVIPGILADKFWQGMFAWISADWFSLFPLVGWSRGIFGYLYHRNFWISLCFMLPYLVLFFIVLKLVLVHSDEYYEDVLETTQSNEEKKDKIKQKKGNSESAFSLNSGKKLNLPDFGWGANALYWRTYVHSSRQDFHPLFGIYSLGLAAIGVILAILSRMDIMTHKLVYGYFLSTVLLYFIAGMSRSQMGDLKKPFYILIPDTWSAKFWNLIRLDIYQSLIFSVLLIVPTVFIAELDGWLIVMFPICLLSFYITGFTISLTAHVGFEEAWDRKFIKPLITGGVLVFGILPALAMGLFVYLISHQFAYGMWGIGIAMLVVAGIMLHVSLDMMKKVEFKEV